MRMTLDSGREIWLARFHQYPTYYGLLCGRPGPRDFPRYVEEALTVARKHSFKDTEPCMLPRPELQKPLPIASIAVFDSGQLARPGTELYSRLTVAWFQEEFGLPSSPRVLKDLAAVNWEALAIDWTW